MKLDLLIGRSKLAQLVYPWAMPLAVCVAALAQAAGGSQALAEDTVGMRTRWAEQVTAGQVLPEYPRPQLVRSGWQNLNGKWDLAIRPLGEAAPESYDSKILVPFPVESLLSGVQKPVTPDQAVWYSRSFQATKPALGRRLLLHFGAVDWDATVFVNGKEVGRHQGGFDPFTFDVTDALVASPKQSLVVKVIDPTDQSYQPSGKQSLEPGGIVYTAVTGIWQTVWLEEVPETYIQSVKLTPDVDAEQLVLDVRVVGPDADRAIIRAKIPREGQEPITKTSGGNSVFRMSVPKPKLWSPENPHLYDLELTLSVDKLGRMREVVDLVGSYFGMRKVELRNDDQGVARIFLNNQAVFNYGPLDQGWWPDGLYTAPTDEALRYDVEVTKEFGFNMCRKHVKVEPARWYYWCDKLGLLVWQDMPDGDRAIGPNDPDIERTAESEACYRRELTAMLNGLHNSPSVIVWVPFNEGWGQFKTNEIIEWVQDYDPTRLVDGPSGWKDRGVGDCIDMHSYPGPAMHPVEEGRASVLGEFGGLGHAVKDHLWRETGNWGYNYYDDLAALKEHYAMLVNTLWLMKGRGLAAAVYTQTTDVEGEVNGLLTYDRDVLKLDPSELRQWNQRVYGPRPTVTNLVDTSQDPHSRGEQWQYSVQAPPADWAKPGFDDSAWKTGRGGFGTPNTPGAVVRTEWDSGEIWMRRTVSFQEEDLKDKLVYLHVHHDEDARVYFNGKLIAELSGWTTDYCVVPLDEEAVHSLSAGDGVLAVHCRQDTGGQYIDVGLIAVSAGADANVREAASKEQLTLENREEAGRNRAAVGATAGLPQ